jgi:hypothetical protein
MAYIGKQPVVGNFVKLDAIVTSATATYNLLNGGVAYFPQTANNCIVSLNGVIQSPTSAYTISGSTIVFDSALTSADSIDFILVLGDVLNIGTPSDATVGFAKVTSNLITGATAETSIAGGDSVLIYDDSASALRKMTRTNFVSGIGGANTPSFYVFKSSTQTVNNGVTGKVTFQTESFDTDSAYDNSTNHRFTVPSGKDGKYLFMAHISWVAGNNFSSTQFFYKNGTAFNHSTQGTGNYGAKTTFVILDLVATDYVEIFVLPDSGSNETIEFATAPHRTWFLGFKLI